MQFKKRRNQVLLSLGLLLLSGFTSFAQRAYLTRYGNAALAAKNTLTPHPPEHAGRDKAKLTNAAAVTHAEAALEPAQSGGSYNVTQAVIAGGGGTSANGATNVTGSIGQSAAVAASGGSYTVSGGFWGGGASAQCSVITVNPVTLPVGAMGVFYHTNGWHRRDWLQPERRQLAIRVEFVGGGCACRCVNAGGQFQLHRQSHRRKWMHWHAGLYPDAERRLPCAHNCSGDIAGFESRHVLQPNADSERRRCALHLCRDRRVFAERRELDATRLAVRYAHGGRQFQLHHHRDRCEWLPERERLQLHRLGFVQSADGLARDAYRRHGGRKLQQHTHCSGRRTRLQLQCERRRAACRIESFIRRRIGGYARLRWNLRFHGAGTGRQWLRGFASV